MRIGHFIVPLTAATVSVITLGQAAHADLLINIDKTAQRMTVTVNGEQLYDWPVSSGGSGYDTPSGTFKPFRMEIDHHSDEWDNAPMPYSIFFTKIGHAIHGTYMQRNLGQPVSHGCVRLSVKNAATLWKLVKQKKMANTTVVLSGAIQDAGPVARRRPMPLNPDDVTTYPPVIFEFGPLSRIALAYRGRVMRELTYLIIVALASLLVAPPFSAFAQRERGPPRLEGRRLEQRTPLRPQTFRPVYRGQLAWRNGRWHQAERNGRLGWWWDVGGFWYFYPEQTEGPPDYVSDVEVAVADDAPAAPPPRLPPPQPKQAFYYHPGDLKGVPYTTIEECTKARERAGDVGVCVYK